MSELKLNETLFKQILNAAGSAILITDTSGRIKYINPRFNEITGYQPAEILGKTPRVLNSGVMPPDFYAELWGTIRQGRGWRGRVTNKAKNGSLYCAMQSITPIKDDSGKVIMYLSLSDDVTDSEKTTAQYKTLAFNDELTGLGNRRMFRSDLAMRIDMVNRSDDVHCLLLININDFKSVNDVMGHEWGDKILLGTARRLRHCAEALGEFYRLGSDRFAVLAGPFLDRAAIDTLVDRIHAELQQALTIDGRQVDVYYSLGAAVLPEDSRDAATLLQHCEIAVGRSRSQLGTCLTFYRHELQRLDRADGQLLSDFIKAIDHRQLQMVAQPVVDLAHDSVYAIEMLLRWEHPIRGPISPPSMIRLAENYGYLHKLSCLIVDQVITFMQRLNKTLGQRKVAINLNVAQVLDTQLVDYLCERLDDTGIARAQIIIELVENDRFNFADLATRKRLTHLRDCGFVLALDDFGSGYATFEFINEVNPDIIKVDRGLLNDIDINHKKLLTLKSVLALTRNLGVVTVVEGVETEQQHDILKNLPHAGLKAQGYYFARPMGLHELADILTKDTAGALFSTNALPSA